MSPYCVAYKPHFGVIILRKSLRADAQRRKRNNFGYLDNFPSVADPQQMSGVCSGRGLSLRHPVVQATYLRGYSALQSIRRGEAIFSEAS